MSDDATPPTPASQDSGRQHNDSMTAGRFRLALLLIGVAATVAALVAVPVAILTTLVVVSSRNAGPGATPRRDVEIFEQKGTFWLIAGEAGAVGFPIPYCEPTTHRGGFSDNASWSFRCSRPTTHRGGWCRRRLLAGRHEAFL